MEKQFSTPRRRDAEKRQKEKLCVCGVCANNPAKFWSERHQEYAVQIKPRLIVPRFRLTISVIALTKSYIGPPDLYS
jgi:hypothetical protein